MKACLIRVHSTQASKPRAFTLGLLDWRKKKSSVVREAICEVLLHVMVKLTTTVNTLRSTIHQSTKYGHETNTTFSQSPHGTFMPHCSQPINVKVYITSNATCSHTNRHNVRPMKSQHIQADLFPVIHQRTNKH